MDMSISQGIDAIVMLLGIWVALYGIDSWRREHSGKRKMELAEDSIALFYEAVDAIKHIRHPASWGGEHLDLEKGDRETNAQFEARKNASVIFYRYNQYQELFSRLYASRYRFMAQIGKDEAGPFNELKSVLDEIVSSARRLSRLWAQDNFRTEEQQRQHQERVDRYEAVFWDGMEEDDPINPRLEAIIANIEVACNEVIIGKGTLHGFLNISLSGRR